jgi:hypothetical protein
LQAAIGQRRKTAEWFDPDLPFPWNFIFFAALADLSPVFRAQLNGAGERG